MKPAIVFQTDFTKGMATSTMYGVINNIDETLKVYDSNQYIQPFNTYEASINLDYIAPYWKQGTIFISVVDPGVGTDRKASVALLENGSYVVSPDNGSLTHMKRNIGIKEIREIDENTNRLETTKEVSIFHGRDLFAYCAAKLAAGIITFEEVGPKYSVDDIVEHKIFEPTFEDGLLTGMIQSSSLNFGLVNTNISYKVFEENEIEHGALIDTKVLYNDQIIFHDVLSYQPSFGYVNEGEPLVMISESKHLQIAKNLGNIAKEYDIECGPEWKIQFNLNRE